MICDLKKSRIVLIQEIKFNPFIDNSLNIFSDEQVEINGKIEIESSLK